MSLFRDATHRDTILFVNGIRPSTIEAIETYGNRYDKTIKILILVDSKKKSLIQAAQAYARHKKVSVQICDFSSHVKIQQAIAPHREQLLAVSSQFENSMPDLKKLLPHVPYLNGPTEESLDWSTDKVMMRKLLQAYDPQITPPFTVIKEFSESAVTQVEKKVGYPVVVKPSGLAASLLVTVCYHHEELEEALRTVFRKINKLYKQKHGRGEPQVLVEKMMEGTMYSIDVYVNSRGVTYFTPPVHVKTGRAIGFDDFFGYQQLTPTKLTKTKIEQANHVADQAIQALGLRSTTCHVELMYTTEGWKVIEVAPRVGGFRHTLYSWSYGINHLLNDILIRIPQQPIIPKKRKGFVAAFKIFGKKEGKLETIKGIKKVKELKSFVHLDQNKSKGDALHFAKNGGDAVLVISLFNKNRSDLLADIRRMEKAIEIVVTPKGRQSKNV